MKFKINYTKKGSEAVIDRLSEYVERWGIRKQQQRRRNTHVVSDNILDNKTVARRTNNVMRTVDDDACIAPQRQRTTHKVQPYERSNDAISNNGRPYRQPAQYSKQPHNKYPERPSKPLQKQPAKSRKSGTKKILARVGISVLTFLLAVIVSAVCAVNVVLHGPSEAARDRFVLTVMETSAAKFLATWFLPGETVKRIVKDNAVIGTDDNTDPTLIKLPGNNPQGPDDPEKPSVDMNKVELIDIVGKTYRGKLLIVQDPKRVFIGTPERYGTDSAGVTTLNMVKQKNALYGVNGGGFYDTGSGNGGIPTGRENSDGIVISKGKLMYGNRNSEYEIIGINKQGILVLGKMTAQAALDRGIVEALNFGPYLIINGKPCEVGGFTEAGLNPRTAIGQRSDGAMLLLTIDGRQPSSMGATYEDMIEIMMEYGAVNAANLDGGSSTYMAQNSETENNPKIITQCASLYGPRRMATSIIVSRVGQINDQYEQSNPNGQ